MKRKFKYIITASLPADEQTELDQIIAEMGQIYSKAKVCEHCFKKKYFSLT